MKVTDERFVFCGETVELARLVADLLIQHSIPCEVIEMVKSSSTVTIPDLVRPMINTYGSSLTDASTELRAVQSGIDVMYGAVIRIVDPDLVSGAKKWLSVHAGRIDRWRRELTVTAFCYDCRRYNVFPRSLSGTVQSCRQCLRFVDVPGDDPEWEGVDWRQGGESEE